MTVVTDERKAVRQMEIEDEMIAYFQRKEMIKELTEANKLSMEKFEEFMEDMLDDFVIAPLLDGTFAVLRRRVREVEKLDKKALALRILVTPQDLKKPFDFSILTQQGKLTPRLITEHTEHETKTVVSLTRRKTAPKKKDNGNG